MKTMTICFIISTLFTQSIFASDIQRRKSISDPAKMDRIAQSVVQDSQFRTEDDSSAKEQKAWRQRHPVGFGALVGFGIGLGYTLFLATGGDLNFPFALLVFGTAGAGIGAFIGSFF